VNVAGRLWIEGSRTSLTLPELTMAFIRKRRRERWQRKIEKRARAIRAR
jgi:hypothetical protein